MGFPETGARAHHRAETVRISERVSAAGNRTGAFYLYSDGVHTICFDSGSNAERANRRLARLEIDPAQVSHVFLTHADRDHVGGLDVFGAATVYLPEAEVAIANGSVPRKIILFRLRGRLDHPYTTVDAEQTVTVGAIAVRAIPTPGHTPGSTSYLVNEEMLVTGDLLMLRRGRCRPMPRFLCNDPAEDKRSIRELAQRVRSVGVLCTAHSGYTTDYEYAMAEHR